MVVLVIVIVLILGAVQLWGAEPSTRSTGNSDLEIRGTVDAVVEISGMVVVTLERGQTVAIDLDAGTIDLSIPGCTVSHSAADGTYRVECPQ